MMARPDCCIRADAVLLPQAIPPVNPTSLMAELLVLGTNQQAVNHLDAPPSTYFSKLHVHIVLISARCGANFPPVAMSPSSLETVQARSAQAPTVLSKLYRVMFYWSSKPETLEDLEDLLNEPPPALPFLTGDVERLPVSSNSSCPLDHDAKPGVQQEKQLSSSTPSPAEDEGGSWPQRLAGSALLAQPSSSARAASQHQATDATGSSEGWLNYLPGSSTLLSRYNSSDTANHAPSKTHSCSDSGLSSPQVGTTLAQPQPVAGGWLHYVPGSGLLVWRHSTDSQAAAAAAASLSESQEKMGQHSACSSKSSSLAGQAIATPPGWHLPYLHVPSLPWPSGSVTAKPAPQPEERELEVLGNKSSEGAVLSTEGTPGEAGAGDKKQQQQQQQSPALSSQLSAALHRSWHQAEAVVISPLGVSVIGAAVGGVVAGPFGVAVGAKAGAALVVGGALSGAAAHYATHWHPQGAPTAQGGTKAPGADEGFALQQQEPLPNQVAAADPPTDEASGIEEQAEQPLVAGGPEGSPSSQPPTCTTVDGNSSLATEQQA